MSQSSTSHLADSEALLASGSTFHNFQLVDTCKVAEIEGTAYVFRHIPSGARCMWIAADDNNKSFSIAFKTPPTDDTGVFHILEHSVLCGSRKYPVKEPFVHLIKTSMNTFLNAMTFPDKTMYPVASTNMRDLENLMDIYLDAVFHPAIYTNEHIFQQEGWHLELNDQRDELSYNGVVYNEMQGALSDPDEVLLENINRQLFPDTAYGFESGGDPRSIPCLSYEDFLDNHRRHYTLENSYSILYGDLDIDRQLMRLDACFAGVTSHEDAMTKGINPLEEQAPLEPSSLTVEMENAPSNSTCGLGFVVAKAEDRQRNLALNILVDALMGSNEAPLKKRLLKANIADEASAYVMDSVLQTELIFQLKGTHEGSAEAFKELVFSTCQRLVKRGIDKARLRSAVSLAEFTLREADFGYLPTGVALSIQAMGSWLYDDENPTGNLEYEQALKHMREGIDTGYFEALLDEVVCKNPHYTLVDLVCTSEGVNDKEDRLAALLQDLTEDQISRIEQDQKALREAQETPDSPEDIAKLPQLTLADISDAPAEPEQMAMDAPLPCQYHNIKTHGIDYISANFWLDGVLWEHLPYVSLICDLLGKLDTDRHSASELDTLIEENLGNLSFFTNAYEDFNDRDQIRCALVMTCSTLSDKVNQPARIIPEILLHTRYDDKEKIRQIMIQRKTAMEQAFIGAGHSCALSRINSYFTRLGLTAEKISGIEYYRFICDMLENFDKRFDSLRDTMEYIAQMIFVSNNVDFSFTGEMDDAEYFWDESGRFGLSESRTEIQPVLSIPEPKVRNEAFMVPSNVVYCAMGADTLPLGGEMNGVWNVASRALSFDYLWNEVRVMGGAYGCGFKFTGSCIAENYSYRDPQTDATFSRFDGDAQWLADWQPTQEELVGYIVSSVAAMDAPLKPRAMARRQDVSRYCNQPEGWRELIRQQEIGCTTDQIHQLARQLQEAYDQEKAYCIFGNEELIEDSKQRMKKLRLID